MGTPEFACPTLQKLIDAKDIEIVAVYTKEPKIAGRGHKVTNSQIHNLALKHNLKVLTPKSLKTDKEQQEFRDFNADLAVVVAYGLILPSAILQGTKFGCVNIHPSILPKWRGAAPIQRTLMNGDQETGVAIMKMDEGVDSGDVIYQSKFALDDSITYGELAQKFAVEGADALLQSVRNIVKGDYQLTKQDHQQATHAAKISKEEAQIDWILPAKQINNQIRGLSGNIGSYFFYKEERIKILKAQIIKAEEIATYEKRKAGDILEDKFIIICAENAIRPLLVQRAGKRQVTIDEFLLGLK